jgi:antitoxin CptB
MRIEERGLRSAVGEEAEGLNPRSSLHDPVVLERIRWRCRRGLLELDIVLGRFVERHYAGLDDAGRAGFDALLDMPDTELWDMITAGRGKAPPPGCGEVLKLLQES